MQFRYLFFFALPLLLLFSQTKAGIASDSTVVKDQGKKLRITPLPVLMYSPETRLGLGGLGIFSFSLGKDSLTRPSYLQSSVIVTINKQIDSDNDLLLFTNQEKYMVRGRFRYMHMPEFYFGVGNELPDTNQQLVTYNRLWLEAKVLRRISGKNFAGLYMRSNDIFKTRPKGEGIWQHQPYRGQEGYHISGVGVDLIRDTRDLTYNASRGYFVELAFLCYGKATLSDYRMNSYLADVRKYFTVWKKKRHVFCFQALFQGTTGQVPYKDLPEMGGPMMMRGYYRGRYRDKNYTSFQIEYRLPVWRFLGMTAWAGTGSVDSEFIQPDLNAWKPNYGIGARFRINKKEMMNVRFDYGFGKKISGLYVDILEAF